MRDSTKAGFIGRGGQREDSGLTRVPREPEEGPLRRRLSGHWPKLPQRPCQRSTFRRRSHIIVRVWIVGNRTKLRVGARTDPFPLNLSLHCCTVRNRALRTVYYCVCVWTVLYSVFLSSTSFSFQKVFLSTRTLGTSSITDE